MTTRQDLLRLDAEDALAPLREQFELPDGVIYLDGNSLGAMPRATAARVQQVVAFEWGRDLIKSRIGAVEHDDGFETIAIGVDERAHAAEIAFALFADVSDEEKGALRLDASFVKRTRQRDEGNEAGAVPKVLADRMPPSVPSTSGK